MATEMIPATSSGTFPPPRTAGPKRQLVQFNSIEDVLKTAEYVYMSGNLPSGCDSKYKVFMMLMAGMEVGFGVSQSMNWITPPLNGRCSIYGDGGLALIRSSGQLEKFSERIEGEGDDRKAVVVIQRKGWPERTFEYPMALAKKLKSFKASQAKGGPWADDPDNMLTWRARWRAFRTEFTDILGGLGGAEEQEDDYITVDASPRQTAPAALPAAAVDAQPVMSDEQFEEMKRLRKLFAEQFTATAGADADEWKSVLQAVGVDSIKALTPELAGQFIQLAGKKVDPFNYPPALPAAV